MKSEIDKLLQKIKSILDKKGGRVLVSYLDDSTEDDDVHAIYSRSDFYLINYYLHSGDNIINMQSYKKLLKNYGIFVMVFKESLYFSVFSDFEKNNTLSMIKNDIERFNETISNALLNKRRFIELWESISDKEYNE